MNSLLEIIKKVQEKYPVFSQRWTEAEALGRWEKAVGSLIAKHARAIRVQNAVLWVEVEHPIWKSELHYRKQQILDILNGKIPGADKQLSPAKEPLVDLLLVSPRKKSGN